MSTETTSRILRSIPREKAFYFFTSIGNYTGASSSSLREFAERIANVNVKSLEFHLYRGDFEKWISEVLQDEGLAIEIKRIQRFNLTGDALRNQLDLVVSRRLKQLTSQFGSKEFQTF